MRNIISNEKRHFQRQTSITSRNVICGLIVVFIDAALKSSRRVASRQTN